MKKQWKRLAALSSALVMAAGTLLYVPTDTLQNISWGITVSAEDAGAGTESGSQTWHYGDLTWTLSADGTTMTVSGKGEMTDSPARNNSNIKKVVIEDGVTSIGDSAFSWCSSLTSITIPSSVTSIGNGEFRECSSLTDITIPGSVTSIGSDAFSWCSSLTDITIPSSVTSIGSGAFLGCTNLTSITNPRSVTRNGAGVLNH